MEEMQKPREGTAEEERELFRQVWQRVTETGGGENPIEALPAAEQRLAVPDPGAELEHRCSELRAALGEALASASACGDLSRRLGNRPAGRRLRDMAAAARRRSRRLAVACFLLDGVWYLPQNAGETRRETTVMGGLRERYLAERRSEEGCRSAAARAEDGELAALWLDLAAESRENAQVLRRLLEEL